MKTVKNISPLGALAIPALRLEVAAGAIVELTNAAADLLLEQATNFVEVKKAPLTDEQKKAKADAAAKKRAATAAATKTAAAPAAEPADSQKEI